MSALFLLLLISSSQVQAQGVRYSLTPSADYTNWDDDLGLEDATFYGARFGLDFGALAGLEGFYFTRSSLGANLAGTSLPSGPLPFASQDADLHHYGVDLTINLSPGRLVPFIKAGAGVLEVRPEASADLDQVVWQYGAGVKVDFSERFRGIVYIEDARFKLDRYALAPGGRPTGLGPDPDADESRSNLSVGAGLGFALGGSRFDRGNAPRERWSLASIPIEPFAGRLQFDDKSLGDQDLAGLRAGINLGQYLSLRGYYWRGVGSFFNDTDPIQSYGAEAQFNFRRGTGLSPYLILGGGNLDFRPSFRDRNGLTRSDRTVLLAGLGLGIRLTDQFRLNASVRDYVYSDNGIDAVSTTGDLRHNPLFSAGISFDLGRGHEEARQPVSRTMAAEPMSEESTPDTKVSAKPSAQDTVKSQNMASKGKVGGGNVSTEVVMIPVPATGELYVRYGDPVERRDQAPSRGVGFLSSDNGLSARDMQMLREEMRDAIRQEMAQSAGPAPAVSPDSARSVNQAISRSEMREEIRRLLAEERPANRRMNRNADSASSYVAPAPAPAPSAQDQAVMEDRLVRRMDSLISARLAQQDDQRNELKEMEERLNRRIESSVAPAAQAAPSTPTTVVVTPGAPLTRRDSVRAQAMVNPSFSALQPTIYSGVGLDGPTQILVGGRVDLTPFVDWGAFSLVPEFSFGLFDGTSVMGAANIEYTLPVFEVKGRSINPMVRLGLGFFRFTEGDNSSTEGTLNFTYGFSTPVGGPKLTGERPYLFIEHQGLDLFDFNRLLVGVQWKY